MKKKLIVAGFVLVGLVISNVGIGQGTDPIFTIGTKWTYDFSWIVPGGPTGQEEIEFGVFVYSVTDTMRQNDTLVYVVENNRYSSGSRLMYQEGEKVYLKDVNSWQLTYDFGNPDQYRSAFFNPFINKEDTAIVNVSLDLDSYEFGDRGLQTIQHLSIDNNGTYENMPITVDVLHHCGSLYGGIPLGIGLALADPPYLIGNLRCFEQGDFIHNFTGIEGDSAYIACDSVRFVSSVKNEYLETVKISPNPFNEQLNIALESSENMIGRLVNSSGQVVRMVEIKTSEVLDGLEHLASGFYAFILSDQQGNVLQVKKMIKE